MNPAPTRLLCALCSLGFVQGASAAISTESPFLPKNGQAVAAPTENTPIELRGVMATPDGLRFAIYEPAVQKGSWVKANETGFSFVVRSYDAGKSAVTVDYQGRPQTLTLKEARFDGTVAPAPMAPGAANQIRPAGPGAAPAIAANPAEEAKRLEQVANEVRRRRAARQAATQGGSGAPAPTTTTTP